MKGYSDSKSYAIESVGVEPLVGVLMDINGKKKSDIGDGLIVQGDRYDYFVGSVDQVVVYGPVSVPDNHKKTNSPS